ncbi:hypothetical protein LEP3755_04260 [Leptolyngbya sp. NIES-3755]|nr:hypothetical protein LEP3755_04260 [Leptolyngbya sp. NIES-3755]
MLDIDKQYVFNEQGEAIAVQIPLDQFQRIEHLLSNVPDAQPQDESESDQPEAELEYVNGVPVIKSYGGNLPASIVDDMREERIRELGGW